MLPRLLTPNGGRWQKPELREGLVAAPKKLDHKTAAMAQQLYDAGDHSIADICRMLGISRATFYRTVKIHAVANKHSSEET